jgi:SAM-dependent methyltransferase
MFEKLTGLFKKESKPKEPSEKVLDQSRLPNDGDLIPAPPIQLGLTVDEDELPLEPITESIGSEGFVDTEDFDIRLSADADFDEEKALADITAAIKEELLKAETVEDVDKKADEITDQIGITDTEWEEVYMNVSLIGYESRQQQIDIFSNTCPKEFNVYADTVLDVGCGIGDFFAYCQEILNCLEPKYSGIDYNGNMIELAKKKFPEAENNLSAEDLLDVDGNYDWVIAMSAFNVPMQDDMDSYIKQCIDKMYSLCNKGIGFNLLNTDEGYAPKDILNYVLDKYENVKFHNNFIEDNYYIQIFKTETE